MEKKRQKITVKSLHDDLIEITIKVDKEAWKMVGIPQQLTPIMKIDEQVAELHKSLSHGDEMYFQKLIAEQKEAEERAKTEAGSAKKGAAGGEQVDKMKDKE